jgi:predicted aminopeptidase
MHHQRMLRHGDPFIVRPRRAKQVVDCKWVNCSKTSITKGYCSKHYYIQRVIGASQINVT